MPGKNVIGILSGSMTTPSSPGQIRMTPKQAVGWGVAFLVIVALIIAFFLYGRQVRPMIGALPAEAWLTNLS